MTKINLLGATAIALLACSPALAQTTPAPPAPAPDAAPAAADAAPAPAAGTQAATDQADAGQDIIVTATKRERTLQDTPIAVSVTTAATIQQAQIRDLIDLQTVVPSLRVNQLQSSANTNFIIRGFGNGANNAGIEPSVGVFIDGVYRSRSAAQIGDLPNVQRIEVLRGPQSTLFGKNASAGIISIVTAEPSLNKTKGSAEVTYGNYNEVVVKGDLSGPLTDTLGYAIAGNYNRRDGYIRDTALNKDVNNRNRYGFRAQLLWQPSADLKFRLIGDYDKIDEDCCGVVNLINGPTGAIVNALAGGVGLYPNTPFNYQVRTNFLSTNNIDNYGVSLQSDWNLGKFALTGITSYREVLNNTNQDSDFTSADLIGRNSANVGIHTFTQELRLTSNLDGPVNFLLGAYYFNEKIDQSNAIYFGSQFRGYGDQLIRASSGNALNLATLEGALGAFDGNPARYAGQFFRTNTGLDEQYALKDDSASVFGTVDFKPIERLTLTGGFNYTDDSKRFSTNVVSSDVFSGINLDAAQYAPFRNQLLVGGALAAGVPLAQAQAFANAVQNIPIYNPLGVDPALQTACRAAQTTPPPGLPGPSSCGSGLRAFQFLPPFLNVPNSVEPARTHDTNFSYTARASYKVNNNFNVYFTWATGFKASSINLSRDSRPTATDLVAIRQAGLSTVNLISGSRFAGPEKSRVIEGGIKYKSSRAFANLAIFQQEITGFQSNIFSGTGFVLINAPKESVFGVEFEGSATPVKSLTVNLAITYLDPKYDSFPQGVSIGGPNLTLVPTDLSGTRPAGIPEWSLSVGGTYTHELNDAVKLLFRGDYQYNSPTQISEGVVTLEREQKSLNLSLTAQIHDKFEISVWGRNVLDDQYITTIFSSVAQAGSISGYPSQPATYGGTLRVKF